KERRRFVELRKRLKKRWRKHWHAHEADLRRREGELEAGRAQLQHAEEKLQREQVRLTQARLRHSGEVELEHRKMQDEWQQLGLAQQQWEACLNHEQSERALRLCDLERRAATLTAMERGVAEQRQLLEQLQLKLRKEADGLESRIRNQRLKLIEQEKRLSDL